MAIAHTTGGEATGEAFYQGRHKYVEELGKKVDNSQDNLILILGPRRIGKTTIVKQFFLERNSDTSDPGIYVYIYIPRINNLYDFYKVAIEEIGKALKENSDKEKILPLTTKSSVVKLMGSIMDRIEKIDIAGQGVEIRKADGWKKYLNELSIIQGEFIDLIRELNNEKIVLGFDEVPEAIQYLLKNNPEKGKDEVDIWLEHFRELRHKDELKDSVNLILFGSVNMKLTLESIGHSKVVNDNYTIEIEPLELEEVKELLWDLVETLGYTVLDDNKQSVESFVEKMLACCSPWSIQNFLDQFDPEKAKSDLDSALKEAYLRLFDISGGGVRYLKERLDKYYSGNIKIITEVLKFMAKEHIDNAKDSIEDSDLFKAITEDREEYQKIIDILLLDNMIYREGTGFLVKNTVEKNFWYNSLVGSCKF